MKRLFTLLAAGALASACGSSSNNTNVVNVDPSMGESAISAKFSGAAANSTIQMAAGTYKFTNTLALSTQTGVTVQGAGIGQTILDWSGQTAGADGISQNVPAGGTVKVQFNGLTIQDTIGNGIKVTGGNGVHFNNIEVKWPTRMTHGGYGIYPVQSKNVLVENSKISGAADTGIYVGQSDTIVVRNNECFQNVAGIEIENSFNADVTANNSHDNTVGFLVFDLPDLQQVGGHNIRVYGNQFVNNNTPNFGDPSGTVAKVPAGTGGAVMANTMVEVFNNTFTGNTTAGFAAISCFTGVDPDPQHGACVTGNANYIPFPGLVHVHNNTFSGTGTNPLMNNTNTSHPSFALAYLLSTGLPPASGPHLFPDGHVSEVLWDGVASPFNASYVQVCSTGNTAEHFHDANMHLASVDLSNPDLSQVMTFDEASWNCTPAGFPLPAVPVPTF